jgi:hypothetical protein
MQTSVICRLLLLTYMYVGALLLAAMSRPRHVAALVDKVNA